MANSPCANFFPEFTVIPGSACLDAALVGDGSCDDPWELNIDVAISEDPGNVVECRDDGLYAVPEMLCYRINMPITGGLFLNESCQVCEYIPGGSTIAFLPVHLDEPSVGSAVVYEIRTTGGGLISTLTIPAGSNTGTWSTSTWTATTPTYICGEVVGVGSNACGLSVPIQVCDETSILADPSAFYANLDPTQICQIVANNCNATLINNGNGTFTFTSNDGTTANFDVAGFIDVCAEVAANCNATLVDNGNETFTFTSNDGSTVTVDYGTPCISGDPNNTLGLGSDGCLFVPPSAALVSPDACNELEQSAAGLFVREHTSISTERLGGGTLTVSGPNANALPAGTSVLNTTQTYWTVTNPSACRSMAFLMTGGGRIRTRMSKPAHDYSVDDTWSIEANINGGAWSNWQLTQVNESASTFTSHSYMDHDERVFVLAPGASATFGVRFTLTRNSATAGNPYQSVVYNYPRWGLIGSTI